MRIGLLAVALLGLAVSTAPAADPLPPVVFQSQPIGRVIDDVRSGAKLVGGDKAVKAFNDALKDLLGEKGLEGVDIGRPVVGYVVLAPKPEDITVVVAIPINVEKEFLDLCERLNKQKPKLAGKEKDVYELPPLDPRYKAFLRFQDRYAYIAYGHNPMPQLDSKLLVPMAKLYDPNEKGIVAARVYFDRIPLAVKIAAPALFDEVKKTLFSGGGIGKQELVLLNPAIAELEKLFVRYGKLAAGAESMAARLVLDVPSGDLVVEATLSGKPDSELAKLIAARKPTTNKFGALLNHKDTAGAILFRLPLFEEEIRNAATAGLDAGLKEALKTAPDIAKPLVEELFKGLTRTVKTGEFDMAATVRGPDKNGYFTGIYAIAFEDTTKLEKELKTYIQKEAPPEIVDAIKWDAAKAGTVSIHTWKLMNLGFVDPTKAFGGEDCSIAFAFAPHGVIAAVGPDAIATIKDALAVKPVEAPVLDIVLNPARVNKLVEKVGADAMVDIGIVEAAIGKEDKLVSALSVKLESGKELKLSLTINMKMLPRAMASQWLRRTDGNEVAKPPVPDKK